jgi:hypothetical protein
MTQSLQILPFLEDVLMGPRLTASFPSRAARQERRHVASDGEVTADLTVG